MDTAFENRILLWALAALYAILAALAGAAYVKFQKRWDAVDIWRELVSKELAAIKVEIDHLREWRHQQASEEHRALLQEIKELRQASMKQKGRGAPSP